MELILPIGISGSGKSTLIETMKKVYDGLKIVCPDTIRYNLTGNISDQSRNSEVFEIVETLINDCVSKNVNVYYDATNLNTKYRRKFVNKFENNPNVHITYYVFPADVELSYQRIQNDLKNKVNRSNVPLDVLNRQKKLYNEMILSDFEGENVERIVFLQFKDGKYV